MAKKKDTLYSAVRVEHVEISENVRTAQTTVFDAMKAIFCLLETEIR